MGFKKILGASVLTFALASSCFAAKVNEADVSYKIFQDNDYKISVQLPEGFDYADNTEANVVEAAEDKKGGYYKIVAEDAEASLMDAGTNKEKLHDLKDGIKKEYLKSGLEIYSEYTIKINPNRYGYFLEGYYKGDGDKGKSKNSVIVFFFNNKKYTVTLTSPYGKKGYLKSFKRFRTSITCKE